MTQDELLEKFAEGDFALDILLTVFRVSTYTALQ